MAAGDQHLIAMALEKQRRELVDLMAETLALRDKMARSLQRLESYQCSLEELRMLLDSLSPAARRRFKNASFESP